MAKHSDELLLATLTELKSVNNMLNHMYEQVRIKVITFLGAGLATLTFLYSSDDGNLQKRLFFPHEFYGQVIYCAGLLFFGAALILLFIALKPVTWYYPTELKDLKKLNYRSTNEFLEYAREEYIATFENNSSSYEIKQRLLSISTVFLLIGAIILVVLNRFKDLG